MQRPLAAAVLTIAALSVAACAKAPDPDTRAPTAPRGVTAESGSATTVHVMWSASADDRGVAVYEIHREGRKVKEVPATTLMTDIEGLAPETPYAFTVLARDAAGNRSPHSTKIPVTTLATTRDTQPPTRPASVRGTVTGPRTVTLTWHAATDDTNVTAYDIYQADTRIHTVPGTAGTARITTLRPGTIYTFTVRARDAAENESPDSPPVDLTTPGGAIPTATAPTDLTVTATKREITVTWTPPKPDGAQVTEHQLHLDGHLATTIVWGTTPPPGRATYTFTVQDPPGTRYTVKLRAKLPDGTWGTFSAQRTVVVGGPR
ncbi:fibronectin type III domain-containing protein [Streptomyces sp. NPDC048629]|uniref:fibronectin type III domain-containing protein n=1 Tax=Streptomyces sp. NPDC048629 TaxID=3154824 RepID=UPI003448170A